MSNEPKVGEVWELNVGGLVAIDHVTRHAGGSLFTLQGKCNGVETAFFESDLKRRVELREGQVWRGEGGGTLVLNGPALEVARDRGIAQMVREGWTLVSESEETDDEFKSRVVGELKYADSALPPGLTVVTMRPWNGPQSFAQRHKPLAEAFAALAKAMQTPRGSAGSTRRLPLSTLPRW